MTIHWTERNEILAKTLNIRLNPKIFFEKKKSLIKTKINLHEI